MVVDNCVIVENSCKCDYLIYVKILIILIFKLYIIICNVIFKLKSLIFSLDSLKINDK